MLIGIFKELNISDTNSEIRKVCPGAVKKICNRPNISKLGCFFRMLIMIIDYLKSVVSGRYVF